ncbi:HIT family protein [Streptococcus sp. SGI.013]|uniref:HIT family protein n=1 Tax=unclassified Streptococcus TaxID=2608887 RepID=UPI003D080418
MDSCVFCDIVLRKKSGRIIFENDTTMAFLPNEPDVSAHILVITKDHFVNLNDVSVEKYIELQKTLLMINDHLIKNCGYTGVNILMASGKSAGQSIEHIHYHLIPRNVDDGINAWPVLSNKKHETSEEIFQKLKITF